MGRQLKTLNELYKDVGKIANQNYEKPLMVLDTGALIDIQREFEKESDWRKIKTDFMDNLEKVFDITVTPKVLEEIVCHSKININKHRKEISQGNLKRAEKYGKNFEELYYTIENKVDNKLIFQNYLFVYGPLDDFIYKVSGDRASKIDLDIIRRAIDFSTILTPENIDKPEEVYIMSSDQHLEIGAKAAEAAKYSIKCISTRK